MSLLVKQRGLGFEPTGSKKRKKKGHLSATDGHTQGAGSAGVGAAEGAGAVQVQPAVVVGVEGMVACDVCGVLVEGPVHYAAHMLSPAHMQSIARWVLLSHQVLHRCG